MSKNVKLPTVFAMTGSFAVSNGLMYGVNKNGEEIPVEVIEKTVKGTISNESDGKKAEKPEDIAKANIQTVDVANLPVGTDTLRLKFGFKIVPNVLRPSACNNQDYREVLSSFVNKYIELNGMDELADRYATQILSGDYLWRNKDCLDLDIKVEVKTRDKVIEARNKNGNLEGFDALRDIISNTLSGKNTVAFVKVVADAQLDEIAEVYPSQDFVDDNTKSKHLYSIDNEGVKHAALHSQKIGNALRKIDDWYGDDVRKIAVEPYGVDQEKGVAFRKESDKTSLYTYLRKLDTHLSELEEGIQDHHHFVMACFVRGGVFGGKD